MARIAILGAGAAGCFCAVHLSRLVPDATIEVFESGNRPLAKVSITGGGRCNLTNSFQGVKNLQQAYPRGDKLMKRALRLWNHQQTMEWFQAEGVPLVTQDDECVFPQSQDAMQIVETLLRGMKRGGVKLHLSHRVSEIIPDEQGYSLRFADEKLSDRRFDYVICTIGGQPSSNGLSLIRNLDIEYQAPVPSLFTFNIKDAELNALMGTVVEDATASLTGTKFKANGPLLITHWGMSGPAILKLSSYGARYLAEQNMQADVCINWMGCRNEDEVCELLCRLSAANPQKQIANIYPTQLSSKLWLYILKRSDISSTEKWTDVAGKKLRRLCSLLTSDVYPISGKGQYRDEFVTCGGVSLNSININTLELKNHPNFFLAGEVLDVDAITGGFNLQAAWSMGFVVANAIANNLIDKE